MLVVTRYRVPPGDRTVFLDEARAAVEALARRLGCLEVRVGQAVDEPELWVMQSRWESVGAYRRALSAFDVKERAVPLMYRGLDEASAYEVVLESAVGSPVIERQGSLAQEEE